MSVSSSPLTTGAKPKFVSILTISSVGTSIPSTPLTFAIETFISFGSSEFPVVTST